MIAAVESIAHGLGTPGRGRSGVALEVIAPVPQSASHPRSLSHQHGEGALPLHVEASHRPIPCRFIVLGCIDPGSGGAATTLLDRAQLEFTADDESLLKAAPLLVRSGRRSFYSTILPADGTYLRYDPGCMEAVCERGRHAMSLVEATVRRSVLARHLWRAGDVLVIDNWRALHGRDDAAHATGRRLARMIVDA